MYFITIRNWTCTLTKKKKRNWTCTKPLLLVPTRMVHVPILILQSSMKQANERTKAIMQPWLCVYIPYHHADHVTAFGRLTAPKFLPLHFFRFCPHLPQSSRPWVCELKIGSKPQFCFAFWVTCRPLLPPFSICQHPSTDYMSIFLDPVVGL